LKQVNQFWADQLVDEILAVRPHEEPYIINSGFTPSGPPHIGTLRDFATVTAVSRVMNERGIANKVMVFVDDLDPLRTLSGFLDPKIYEPFMFRPLCQIPWSGTTQTYAEYFAQKTMHLLQDVLGYQLEPHLTSETYTTGSKPMFQFAQRCIDQRHAIREFFDEFKHKPHTEFFFLKLQCSTCDRFVTVKQLDQSTSEVWYDCVHCGSYEAQTLLVPERMKLGWRVEWAGKWIMYHVDFEPCGKDHGSAGGSIDTGAGLLEQIFRTNPPVFCVYEFIQTSKTGLMHKSLQLTDTTEHFLVQLQQIGPEVLNYHLFAKKPSRHLILDLGEVEALYDEFDNAVRRFHQDPTTERALVLAFEHAPIPKRLFSARQIIQQLQIYHSPTKVFEKLKQNETLMEDENQFLRRRIAALDLVRQSRSLKHSRGESNITPDRAILLRFMELLRLETTVDPSAINRIIQTIQLEQDQPRSRIYRTLYQALLHSAHGPPLATILPELGIEEILRRIEHRCSEES